MKENLTEAQFEYPEVTSILNLENKFDTWVEKADYVKLFFLDTKQPKKFKDYLSFQEDNLNTSKQELQEIYQQQGLVEMIKFLSEKSIEHKREQNELGQIAHHEIFGLISFDGKNIHVNDDKEKTSISIEQSFSLLAKHLSEQDIVPDVIEAHSWLMGNDAIRNRIGFEQIEEGVDFNPLAGPEVYGQFVDEKGNLKQKELHYLFQHNEPRYRVTHAQMKVEDFMRRYGKDYIGRNFIIEHDYNHEQEKIMMRDSEKVDDYFRDFNVENWVDNFYTLIKSLPSYQSIAESDELKSFVERLKELEKRKCNIEEVKSGTNTILKELNLEEFFGEHRKNFLDSGKKTEVIYI